MSSQTFEIAILNMLLASALGKFGQLGYIECTFNIRRDDHEHGSERPGEA
jgi:hypothetical protein